MSPRFVFVCPMFNASKTLSTMLHSIVGQSYENWKIVLIDDVSSYEDYELGAEIIKGFKDLMKACGKDPNKICVHFNSLENRGKQWEVSNVLFGIHRHCEDDDIVCRIDADDWLSDLDSLTILNSVYESTKCDVLWTMHRWGFSDRNISSSMPKEADPYKHPWVSSHLKTFRKRLINDVPFENFVNMNGDLVRRCGDQAIYLPVLKKAANRIFLPRVLYHYTIDEQGGAVYQTDDAKFQKQEADYIRNRGFIKEGTSWEKALFK